MTAKLKAAGLLYNFFVGLFVLIGGTWLLLPSLISPRYVLNPIGMTFNHNTQEISLTRETQMARDYSWVDTYAVYRVEAQLLRVPPNQCSGPNGEAFYEIVNDTDSEHKPRFRDTVSLDGKWLADCIDGEDIGAIYHVTYLPIIQINRGILEGARIYLDRASVLQAGIPPPFNNLEQRVDRLEKTIE